MKIIFIVILMFCVGAQRLRAQEISSKTYTLNDGSTLTYDDPRFWHTMGSIPSDIGSFFKESVKTENLPWVAAVGASTLFLVEYDQKLYNNARRAGRKLNISGEDKTKSYIKLGAYSGQIRPVFR